MREESEGGKTMNQKITKNFKNSQNILVLELLGLANPININTHIYNI